MGGRVVSKAALIGTGVSETGEHLVLGIDVASGDMEGCWRRFLESQVARGLSGVQLVISDSPSGLKAAIQAVLVGVSWQRCYVHFLRNVLSVLPKTHQQLAVAAFRTAFMQPNLESAREHFGRAIAALEKRFPEAARCARKAEDDVLCYMSFPVAHGR